MIWSKNNSRQAALGLALGGGSAEALTRKDRRLLVASRLVERDFRIAPGSRANLPQSGKRRFADYTLRAAAKTLRGFE